MSGTGLFDVFRSSRFPLPKLPRLSKESSWNTTFTHQSLPDSNLVLAALGNNVFKACITDWLIDADPRVTQSELEARINERVNDELLSAFSDVYSMPLELRYARSIRDEDRLSTEDRAQVFQAYVGALERDQGFQAVKNWVYELMEWDNMTMLDLLRERASFPYHNTLS